MDLVPRESLPAVELKDGWNLVGVGGPPPPPAAPAPPPPPPAEAKLPEAVLVAGNVPIGLYESVFDVAGPGRVPGKGPRRAFAEGDDWAVLVTAEEDTGSRILTRSITSFRQVGELFRRDREVHRQRLIPPAEMTQELRAIGYRVRVLRGHGSERFPAGLTGFLARKPKRTPSGGIDEPAGLG